MVKLGAGRSWGIQLRETLTLTHSITACKRGATIRIFAEKVVALDVHYCEIAEDYSLIDAQLESPQCWDRGLGICFWKDVGDCCMRV